MSSIPVERTFFLCEKKKKKKKKKEEASPQGKNRAVWGEEAKPLLNIEMMLMRKSDLCIKNEIGVAGRYPVHTLCL